MNTKGATKEIEKVVAIPNRTGSKEKIIAVFRDGSEEVLLAGTTKVGVYQWAARRPGPKTGGEFWQKITVHAREDLARGVPAYCYPAAQVVEIVREHRSHWRGR